MTWWTRLWRRQELDRQLDAELRDHMERLIADYMSAGLSRDEALRRARLEFGGMEQIKEATRDARRIALAVDLHRDIRYAVRQFRRSPGFTLAAVLCLSLGIGAATTIYSVVNTILLQPLAFTDSDRLVRIVEYVPSGRPGGPPRQQGISYPEYVAWRDNARTLAGGIAAMEIGQRMVSTSQGTAGLWGAATSTNTFSMLGVEARVGRTFWPGDGTNTEVVLLSFETWQRHFNADPAVVGTPIEMRAGALMGPAPPRSYTVVGVLPPEFESPTGSADFYTPIEGWTRPPRRPNVTMIGRLENGVSLAAASDELNAMGAAIRPPWPAAAAPLTGPRFEVQGLKDLTVHQFRPALAILLSAVVVVLLIVCANVANLLLARGTARQREMAVRLAIGASRGRIARQIMTECLVLAIAGGALGAGVAAGGVTLVKQLTSVEAPGIFRLMFGSTILPRAHEVHVDLTMLGIAFSIAALTSVVFGLLPAWHLSRISQTGAMRAAGKGSGPVTSRTRAALVIGQLTMATVLLVGAGLLVHSFVLLARNNKGYDASHVVALQLLFPNQYSTPRKVETIGTLLARLRQLPGVQAAGFSRHGLLIGEELFLGPWVPPGRMLDEMRNERTRVRSVSPGFLTAMGVRVVEGREFDDRDAAGAAPVIVMNRSAARQYFGAANPVGQALDWHFMPEQPPQMTVVGVVEDLRQESMADDVFPEIFVDYRQFLSLLERSKQPASRENELAIGFLSFALRTTGEPESAIPVIRQLVRAIDPNIGIDAIVPMERLVASSVARERFYVVMLGAFAGIAALLAAIGIYGLLAYLVVQRTQEIGIRMALGAQRTQLLAMVLRKGLMLTAAGITLGLLGAAGVTRLLQGMLFGITPLDPLTFLAVAVLFALVTTLASYLPARRATRVDPLVALRSD